MEELKAFKYIFREWRNTFFSDCCDYFLLFISLENCIRCYLLTEDIFASIKFDINYDHWNDFAFHENWLRMSERRKSQINGAMKFVNVKSYDMQNKKTKNSLILSTCQTPFSLPMVLSKLFLFMPLLLCEVDLWFGTVHFWFTWFC